jgi:hypothetical protein
MEWLNPSRDYVGIIDACVVVLTGRETSKT